MWYMGNMCLVYSIWHNPLWYVRPCSLAFVKPFFFLYWFTNRRMPGTRQLNQESQMSGVSLVVGVFKVVSHTQCCFYVLLIVYLANKEVVYVWTRVVCIYIEHLEVVSEAAGTSNNLLEKESTCSWNRPLQVMALICSNFTDMYISRNGVFRVCSVFIAVFGSLCFQLCKASTGVCVCVCVRACGFLLTKWIHDFKKQNLLYYRFVSGGASQNPWTKK